MAQAPYSYSSLATLVTNLLTRFGTAGCAVKRPIGTVADPTKPWKGAVAADQVVVASTTILVGGISRLKMGGPAATIDTGFGNESPVVVENSMAFMVGADGASVRAGDYVEIPLTTGGVDRFIIERLNPLKPGGTVLLWQLQLGD